MITSIMNNVLTFRGTAREPELFLMARGAEATKQKVREDGFLTLAECMKLIPHKFEAGHAFKQLAEMN